MKNTIDTKMSRYGFNNNRGAGQQQWRNFGPPPNMYPPQQQQQQDQYAYAEQPRPSRGRGGFRRGGISNKPKENVRVPLDARERGTMPSGQHLSKTNSELKNDPLYLEAFFPTPSEELVPIAEELNHFTGFDGLTTLIQETYENFSSHNLNFKRSVSLSAYAYYISVFAWARVLHLKRLNKYRLTTDEIEFVDMIYQQGNFILPKSVTLYLSGFGNFTIPSGVETKFNTKPYTYDSNGYFENIEKEFFSVTSYPCISIYAECIMRDLAYTNNPDVGTAWSPNDIAQTWNTRCLGYAPSVALHAMQTAIFERAGVTSENFPSDCSGLLINIRLLNAVQKYLAEIPSLESGPIPANLTGSLGQFVIQTVNSTISQVSAAEDIGSISFSSQSPLSCPGSLSFLGGSFLYRIDKNLTAARSKFFFPFEINNPSVAQVNRLNTLNSGWSPIFDQIYHYSNVPFKPVLRVKKFCSIDVKPVSM